MNNVFIYPDLKKKLVYWFWKVNDLVVGIVLLVFGVVLLFQFKTAVGITIMAAYMICTLEYDDMTIIERIKYGIKFLFAEQQHFSWTNYDFQEAKNNGKEVR